MFDDQTEAMLRLVRGVTSRLCGCLLIFRTLAKWVRRMKRKIPDTAKCPGFQVPLVGLEPTTS